MAYLYGAELNTAIAYGRAYEFRTAEQQEAQSSPRAFATILLWPVPMHVIKARGVGCPKQTWRQRAASVEERSQKSGMEASGET